MTKVVVFIGLAILADGLAGLAGGLFSDRWLRRHQPALVGFAAGALLTAVFLDVLPEALQAFGPSALSWAFIGFVAFAFLEWLAGHHHASEGEESPRTLPASLLASDALHNLADGATLASAFLISPQVGLTVAIAVVAHEVPQELGDYALLRAAGFPRRRALLALAAVQLTAAFGAAGIILASERFGGVTAAALSIAAGTYLYIGATDLLPEIHSGKTGDRRQRMIGFVFGIALMVAASVAGAR